MNEFLIHTNDCVHFITPTRIIDSNLDDNVNSTEPSTMHGLDEMQKQTLQQLREYGLTKLIYGRALALENLARHLFT